MSKELTYKDSAGHNGHNYLGDIYEAENSALEKVIQQIVAASKESQELVDIIEPSEPQNRRQRFRCRHMLDEHGKY